MSAQSKLEQIAARRAQIVARCEALRVELSQHYRQFERPVRLTESIVGFGNSLRRSPLFLAGLAAVLLRTPWRKLAWFPKLAWRGWRTLQFVRGLTTLAQRRT